MFADAVERMGCLVKLFRKNNNTYLEWARKIQAPPSYHPWSPRSPNPPLGAKCRLAIFYLAPWPSQLRPSLCLSHPTAASKSVKCPKPSCSPQTAGCLELKGKGRIRTSFCAWETSHCRILVLGLAERAPSADHAIPLVKFDHRICLWESSNIAQVILAFNYGVRQLSIALRRSYIKCCVNQCELLRLVTAILSKPIISDEIKSRWGSLTFDSARRTRFSLP